MKNCLLSWICLSMLFCSTAVNSAVPVQIDLSVAGNKLNATLYPADAAKPAPTVLLLHGIPGNNSYPLGLAPALNAAGISVMVFNYEGTYSSGGVFNFPNCMRDIDCAMDWLRMPGNISEFDIDTSRIVVCGYSHGGSMALTEACYNPLIKNIISVSGPDQFVIAEMMESDNLRRRNFENNMEVVYGPGGTMRHDSLTTLHEMVNKILADKHVYDLKSHAQQLADRHILFVTAWNDMLCPLELHALPLYRRLCELNAKEVSIVALPCDHSYSNVRNELAQLIINWVQ